MGTKLQWPGSRSNPPNKLYAGLDGTVSADFLHPRLAERYAVNADAGYVSRLTDLSTLRMPVLITEPPLPIETQWPTNVLFLLTPYAFLSTPTMNQSTIRAMHSAPMNVPLSLSSSTRDQSRVQEIRPVLLFQSQY